MKSYLRSILVCTILCSIGCGTGTDQKSAPRAATPNSGVSAGKNDSGSTTSAADPAMILILLGMDLRSIDSAHQPAWEVKLPDLAHLKEYNEMAIKYEELAVLNFNQVDIYLDPVGMNPNDRLPFIQTALPAALIKKTKTYVRFPLNGAWIAQFTENFVRIESEEEQKAMQEQRSVDGLKSMQLRILLTDTTRAGNPVVGIMVGNIWEAQSE